MFEDVDQKRAEGPNQAGQRPAPPPTPIIEKPPLEESPFQVKSPDSGGETPSVEPVVPIEPAKSESGSSGKGKIIILIVLIAVILAVAGGGVYYLFFRSTDGGETVNQVANQPENKNESPANTNASLLDAVIQPDKWDDDWIASQFTDEDNDGLNLFGEAWFGTDEEKEDSDADSYSDGSELKSGYHPGKSGKKIDTTEIEDGCRDLLKSAYYKDLPDASDQKKVCELTPSLFGSTKDLGLLTAGSKETLVSYYQDLIDLCENKFLDPEVAKSCVKVLKSVDLNELEPVGLIPGF